MHLPCLYITTATVGTRILPRAGGAPAARAAYHRVNATLRLYLALHEPHDRAQLDGVRRNGGMCLPPTPPAPHLPALLWHFSLLPHTRLQGQGALLPPSPLLKPSTRTADWGYMVGMVGVVAALDLHMAWRAASGIGRKEAMHSQCGRHLRLWDLLLLLCLASIYLFAYLLSTHLHDTLPPI